MGYHLYVVATVKTFSKSNVEILYFAPRPNPPPCSALLGCRVLLGCEVGLLTQPSVLTSVHGRCYHPSCPASMVLYIIVVVRIQYPLCLNTCSFVMHPGSSLEIYGSGGPPTPISSVDGRFLSILVAETILHTGTRYRVSKAWVPAFDRSAICFCAHNE